MIKVSVVIAVYNTEQYLRRCIDSLLEQTLYDIEIICVDDASTDASKNILKEYEAHDDRLKVLEMPKNSGAALARNKGIEMAQGKYVQIVDSDDALEKNALESLYNLAETLQSDMCFFKLCIHGIKGEDVPLGIVGSYKGVFHGKQLLEIFCENREFFLYSSTVLFKREFLEKNSLQYKPITIGEGGEFVIRSLYYAERAVVCDDRYYHYYINEASVTHRADKKINSLIGHIYQYVTVLKLFAKDVTSEELYKFAEHLKKKATSGVRSLSYEDEELIKEKLEDEFSRHIFNNLCMKSELLSDFTEEEKDKMKQSDIIMLYGAGYATGNVIDLLNKYSIEIKGVVVSDKTKNPKAVYGHRVYGLEEIRNFEKEMLVVVTTIERYHETIRKSLNELGFYNTIFLKVKM